MPACTVTHTTTHCSSFCSVRSKLVALAFVVAFLLFLGNSGTLAQTTSTWSGGAGNWAPCPGQGGTALWDTCSTNVFPDGNYNAVVNGGPVTLGAGNGITIDNLTVASGQSVIITPGYLFFTGTSILNNGSISVGASNGLDILGPTTLTLSGSGTVTMTDPNARIDGDSTPPAFVNQQTIQGQGAIGLGALTITNSGTINANVSGGTLTVQPAEKGGMTNTGLMEAGSGSTLAIGFGSNAAFTNTGGTIEALNGGTVNLTTGTYTGGTLTTAGTGIFTTPPGGANPTLNTLTNSGHINVPSGAAIILQGIITNNGTFTVPGELYVGNAATLKGSGAVDLQNGTLTLLTTGSLANQELIHGSGTISSVPITNQGTISADSKGNTLTIAGVALTNTSAINATGGGILTTLSNTTIANTGGTIEALTGSTINLGGTVSGGTLTTSGTGIIQSQNGILDGTANTPTNAGKLDVSTFDLFIQGKVNNTGTIAVGSGVCVILNEPATLAGSGKLTMIPGSCIFGSGNAFTNQSTIEGAGTIGDSNPMPITNTGTILANKAKSTLYVVPDATGFTNTGKLMVNKGSTLDINGLFNNLSTTGTLIGGTYLVTGTLGMEGSIVTNDANFTLTGAAQVVNTLTSTNALVGLAANGSAGTLSLATGQSLTTATNLSNAGKLTVQTGGALTVGGSYTQTAGTTTVDGSLTATTASLQKGSLVGKGTLDGTVTSSTSLTAGDSSTKPGKLTVTGSYTQNPTGTLNVSIGGTGTFGELAVSNGVSLGGTLSIKLINGFVPAIGDSFTIVTGSAVSGQFATVKGTSINSGEHFEVNYNATNVTLTVVSGA